MPSNEASVSTTNTLEKFQSAKTGAVHKADLRAAKAFAGFELQSKPPFFNKLGSGLEIRA